MEKFVRENFDLKLVKKRAELQSIDCLIYINDLIMRSYFTQDAFAKLVGVNPDYLQRVLSCKTTPSIKMYFRLQNGLKQIYDLSNEFQKSKLNESDDNV